MIIKYEACDGISINQEEITKATFFTDVTSNRTYVNCERARGNIYFIDGSKDKFANMFEVDASKVMWIR